MLTSQQLARACGATVTGAVQSFASVVIDGRSPIPGALFVALKGENFDGHQFITQALNSGAIGVCVAADFVMPASVPDVCVMRVNDTLLALQQMAAATRAAFAGRVVAITGSNGKTTTKQLTASVLRAQFGENAVLATEGNLNNHIGVPLTLLKLRGHHKVAVIEMGMNHFNELSLLTRLTKPDVAVITNAGPAHLEGVGSLAGVAKAKGEIFESFGSESTAVLNRDDAFYPYWQVLTRDAHQVTFGVTQDATVNGCFTAPSKLLLSITDNDEQSCTIGLPLIGEHNARNALAAAAVGHALEVSLANIKRGLASAINIAGRLTQNKLTNGTRVIDDSYNANPASMRAAIDVLRAASGKRYLVIGDMAEMGEQWQSMHKDVVEYAAAAQLDGIYTLGPKFKSVCAELGIKSSSFDSIDLLVSALIAVLDNNTTVLTKGAHSMAMHRVIEKLEDLLKEAA
jgi:UDP-N-acetylmuramoyl-tripeptide--D-alanyl-D-alanine ligase